MQCNQPRSGALAISLLGLLATGGCEQAPRQGPDHSASGPLMTELAEAYQAGDAKACKRLADQAAARLRETEDYRTFEPVLNYAGLCILKHGECEDAREWVDPMLVSGCKVRRVRERLDELPRESRVDPERELETFAPPTRSPTKSEHAGP